MSYAFVRDLGLVIVSRYEFSSVLVDVSLFLVIFLSMVSVSYCI